MKVLLLINTIGAGGAERSMVELARFLKSRKGISVKIVCLEHREIGLEEEVEEMGVETIFFEGKGGFLARAKFVQDIVAQENPDIVHSALAESNLIMRFCRLFKPRAKVIQSLVSTPYSEERKKDSQLPWYKFQMVKEIDKWSARIVPGIFYHAITKEVLEHHKKLYQIQENYSVIYRGRYPNPHNHVAKEERFTLINVGRQEFAKGQLVILEALDHLRRHYHIDDIHLLILGRAGHSTEALKDFIKEKGLEKQVSMEGFVRDVDYRLAKAHAFVFPSYYEGLGGALIEAFSAGLPSLCSDIPSLREVAGKKKTVLFSAPGDSVSLADNIHQLYKDQELRMKMGGLALERFETNFRMDRINNQMLEMYTSVLKK